MTAENNHVHSKNKTLATARNLHEILQWEAKHPTVVSCLYIENKKKQRDPTAWCQGIAGRQLCTTFRQNTVCFPELQPKMASFWQNHYAAVRVAHQRSALMMKASWGFQFWVNSIIHRYSLITSRLPAAKMQASLGYSHITACEAEGKRCLFCFPGAVYPSGRAMWSCVIQTRGVK